MQAPLAARGPTSTLSRRPGRWEMLPGVQSWPQTISRAGPATFLGAGTRSPTGRATAAIPGTALIPAVTCATPGHGSAQLGPGTAPKRRLGGSQAALKRTWRQSRPRDKGKRSRAQLRQHRRSLGERRRAVGGAGDKATQDTAAPQPLLAVFNCDGAGQRCGCQAELEPRGAHGESSGTAAQPVFSLCSSLAPSSLIS